MLGFLNLNKPAGFTSHDCVAKLRRILKTKKVGHGGTLDPAATGVLPIAVGKATRLLQFLPEHKTYQARIRLGMTTTTDDLEGEIIRVQNAAHLSLEDIKPLLDQFIGTIKQIPPAYSAIQQDGKRLYQLARKGEKVDVPARIVKVSNIEILDFFPGEFPELSVSIACGGGTYIRSIARDLGAAISVGGTLASLIRTESCGMKLSTSLSFAELETQLQQEKFSLLSADRALEHLNEITLSDSDAMRWCQGQRLNLEIDVCKEKENVLRIYDQNQLFLGIGELHQFESSVILSPKIVLLDRNYPI